MTTTLDLDKLHLDQGKHENRKDGVCLLEAVAWYASENHSDAPACVSPVLRIYGTRLNDVLPDDRRQQLKSLIPVLVDTAGDGFDEARSYMALDWLIRTYTPAWLDLAGLTVEARALRDLRRIVDLVAAQKAGPVVREARDAAQAAARAAAQAAAWDAAWDAQAAAWAAAQAAARDAAQAAAQDAARDAARDARDAAQAAAQAALQPTVDLLQTSAIALYLKMVNPT